ncbi:hypothetical protein ABGV42_00395 [Paenibacillus pabuli]|uniref:hypothetical protein n=1 Tax=Paenibacillus pabuli TaxID=1472 RepID=UPI003241FD59
MSASYEEAKAHRQMLEDWNKEQSAKLKEFEQYGLSPIGGIPDHVRAMPEWKEAKRNYDASFRELRNYNSWFVKTYKKEYAADRKRRFG